MKIASIVIALLVTIVCGVHGCMTYYTYDSKIDAVIERAQVAADREDMLEYMRQLKTNMEKLDMTDGHFAILWKTDENDLALHYKTVGRIIERLEAIKDIPKDDTAYQVALDDIRGTIRELPNPGGATAWREVWWIVVFIGLGIWVLPAFVWLRDDY